MVYCFEVVLMKSVRNMLKPSRPAPSLDEARRKSKNTPGAAPNLIVKKKKAPPRPPSPDLSKAKCKSSWNLNQPQASYNPWYIEWSPPGTPKSTTRNFGGSISSSFSSSTSSLASSKKSFEYDSAFNLTPWTSPSNNQTIAQSNQMPSTQSNTVVPQISVPTIIRAQPRKRNNVPVEHQVPRLSLLCPLSTVPSSPLMPSMPLYTPSTVPNSPPMPLIPPPSPPKVVDEVVVPYGIALYSFDGEESGDLPLQENDIVLLIKRINEEWLYGRIDDKEGMFPANYIEIQVPLPKERYVKALYEFRPQMSGDLELMPHRIVRVLHKISDEWLMGEFNGQKGQFPASYVTDL